MKHNIENKAAQTRRKTNRNARTEKNTSKSPRHSTDHYLYSFQKQAGE
jgi:hypothetical protein